MPRLNRRDFLKVTGAEAGALALASRVSAEPSPDVVVVGAGAFGGWTALHLREKGAAVTLLDAYGPGQLARQLGRGDAADPRGLRGPRAVHALGARGLRPLEGPRGRSAARRLLFETGRLLLAPEWDESLKVTKVVLDKYGVPNEVLKTDELRRRYPQMNAEGVGVALLRAHDRRPEGARRLHRGRGGLPEEGRPVPDRPGPARPPVGRASRRRHPGRRDLGRRRPPSSSPAGPGCARSFPRS